MDRPSGGRCSTPASSHALPEGWAPAMAATMAALVVSACAGLRVPEAAPLCEASGELVTIAQSVPSAQMVPCIEAFPVGWSFSSIDVENDRTEFWLDSDRAGGRAVKVSLRRGCDVVGASPLPAEQPGVEAFLRLATIGEDNSGTWYYVFEGGCVTHEFRFEGDDYSLTPFSIDLQDTLDLFSRATLAEAVKNDLGADLDR